MSSPGQPLLTQTTTRPLSRDWEARLACELLRASRLTVVYGDAAAGKTTLLQEWIHPLLLRQCPDSQEVVVFFDRWDDEPSFALQRQLASLMCVPLPETRMSLPTLLRGWHTPYGTRFLLLLDGFEACLAVPAHRHEAGSLVDELVAVINDTSLPAHVLLAVRSDAEPALGHMKDSIAESDCSWLRLPSWRRSARTAPDAPVFARGLSAADLVARDLDPTSNDDFARTLPISETGPDSRPFSPPVHTPSQSTTWRAVAIGTAALALTAGGLFAFRATGPAPRLAAQASGPPMTASAMQTTVKPDATTRSAAAVIIDDAPPSRPVARDPRDELPGLKNPGALAALDWPDGFVPLSQDPPIALARYDALQAARVVESTNRLQIVAPFVAEHLHVIARADAPLTAWHELAGRAIAFGPAQSADAVTGQTMYRTLFGRLPGAGKASFLTPDAALGALLVTRSVDAMIIAAAHPSAWLSNLDPATRREIKLLKIDPAQPSTQRLVQRFLISDTGGPTEPSLATMSFLVTTAQATPANVASLRRFANQLCQQVPALRDEGHPAWRTVALSTRIDVGWPYSPDTEPVWRSCLP